MRQGSERTGVSARVLAWLAFALLAAGAARAALPDPPEPPTDRLLIKLRDAGAIPRAAVERGAAEERIGALALRKAVPLQYVRTIYNGAHTVGLQRFAQGAELAALVARLAADPEVETVAPDRIKRAANTVPNDPRYGANNGDPTGEFTGQWYLLPPSPNADPTRNLLSPINAEAAWDLSRGSASVPVAVVDTGVLFRHPDLGAVANGGKLLPGYDMIGPDVLPGGSSGPPYTFYTANNGHGRSPDATDPGDWISSSDLTNPATSAIFGQKDPAGNPLCPVTPSSWHGTLVAGVVGAATNDGIGIAGVGWDTPVLPVRVLGKCAGYDSDILDGMAWAAGLPISYPDPTSPNVPTNPNPARIINLSLGSPTSCSSFYSSLISQLAGMNVVVVVAAGNDGAAVSEPANCPGAIAVAALRHIGTKVAFSNLGPEVAISAPGGNCVNLNPPCLYSIVSSGNTGTEGATDAGMTYLDGNQPSVSYSGQTFPGGGVFGTSFAAPMVSGVIALMWAVNPGLTASQVTTMLKSSARTFPAPPAGVAACTAPTGFTVSGGGSECGCTTATCGAGMLDAYGAVLAARNANASPPPLPPAKPAPVAAPLIPAAATASGTGSGSSSGGGGAEAPWWILALLAACTTRAAMKVGARADQRAESTPGVTQLNS